MLSKIWKPSQRCYLWGYQMGPILAIHLSGRKIQACNTGFRKATENPRWENAWCTGELPGALPGAPSGAVGGQGWKMERPGEGPWRSSQGTRRVSQIGAHTSLSGWSLAKGCPGGHELLAPVLLASTGKGAREPSEARREQGPCSEIVRGAGGDLGGAPTLPSAPGIAG